MTKCQYLKGTNFRGRRDENGTFRGTYFRGCTGLKNFAELIFAVRTISNNFLRE